MATGGKSEVEIPVLGVGEVGVVGAEVIEVGDAGVLGEVILEGVALGLATGVTGFGVLEVL